MGRKKKQTWQTNKRVDDKLTAWQASSDTTQAMYGQQTTLDRLSLFWEIDMRHDIS